MTVNSCEPCNCIRGRMDDDTFKQGVHIILCEILTALTGGTADTNVNVAEIGGVAVTVAGLGVHVEDTAHVSGNSGVFALAVRNTNNDALTTTDKDYSPISVSQYGAIFCDISYNQVQVASQSILKQEDAVAGSQDVGVTPLIVRQDTPTSTAADGDYIHTKANNVGAVYNEPANQAATWVSDETDGTGGTITSAGVSILTNSAKIKAVRVYNTLNLPVQISLDAGTTWVMTAAATTGMAEYDLAANGRWAASNVHARTIGGDSGSGILYFSALI